MRKTLAIAALLASAITFASPVQAQQTSVILGSSSVGGSYYLYAGGLSTYLNDHSETLNSTAQTTRGSVENVRLLDAGRIQFGFANGGVVYEQKVGSGQFEGASSDKIRGIATIDIAPLHFVAFAGRGVENLEDLPGKRVSIGAPGSGSANSTMNLFEAADLVDKVEVRNLGFDESAANMRDGNLDAFSASSAIPMPAVMDLAASRDIALLGISDEVIARLREISPAYQPVTIPGGTYDGVEGDVQTIGVPSMYVTHADVPEEVVYEMVRVMFSKGAGTYMRNIYNAWAPEPGASAFEDIDVPMHPGAERFFREQGMLK